MNRFLAAVLVAFLFASGLRAFAQEPDVTPTPEPTLAPTGDQGLDETLQKTLELAEEIEICKLFFWGNYLPIEAEWQQAKVDSENGVISEDELAVAERRYNTKLYETGLYTLLCSLLQELAPEMLGVEPTATLEASPPVGQ